MEQINQTAVLLFGALTGLVGFMFDVPIATLWTAAFGAVIGASIKPPVVFWHGFLLVLGGVITAGFFTPFLSHVLPEAMPQKSISFLAALVLIGGRFLLPEIAQNVLKAAADRLIAVISTWGAK